MRASKPLLALLFVALAFATGRLQSRALEARRQFPAEADTLYLPKAAALRVLSLGHAELTADLIFIRAIIYFGTQFEERGAFKWLDNYLETAVTLDPQYRQPYKWAGVATMYNGKDITNEMVKRSSHFLELAVDKFRDDWEFPFMLGCNYLFEMKTNDRAQRAKWQRQGAEWIRRADLIGGGPYWLPSLAATIYKREGMEEVAIAHLEEVYLVTQNEQTREQIRNKLLSLKASSRVSRWEAQRAAFESDWKASFPYVPPDLFVFLQPRVPLRLDLPAALGLPDEPAAAD